MTVTITVENPVQTPFGLAQILIGRYQQGGSIAVQLVSHRDDAANEPLATFSTNLVGPRTGLDEFCVKSWHENEALVEPMLSTGLFERTGRSYRNGMLSAEVWRIKSSGLVPPPLLEVSVQQGHPTLRNRLHIVPDEQMPGVLKSLSAEHRRWLNDVLLNDEASTDAELKQHIVSSFGMSEEVADAALMFRDQALADPLFHLFDPSEL